MSTRRAGPGRQHLAYLAARMIADDGVPDAATARRKLARQHGVRDERDLPDAREIDQALRSYQSLYQAERHGAQLAALRALAVEAMELLEAFEPWLVGPVLDGTAGAHAHVQLQLCTDRDKDLQLFLLGRQVPYQCSERRVSLPSGPAALPVLLIALPDGDVEALVCASPEARQHARGRQARARLGEVRELLALAGPESAAALPGDAGCPVPDAPWADQDEPASRSHWAASRA